ncbi:hypothetical protein BCY91_12250 [Pelobium manganitolerans]|uniref:Glycosyltransferase 2-like domain-containing protein n=2 Tax=Pelobium manganitolerans TaxID=1842495 RepID=A0A419S1R4_9SPHI|nr:hypothetical protein BCY91_12250 [Pelobium manganitolerans]
MANPLVSICMPAYNAALYIDDAINSVLAQSYQNFELIIVNDGSTDETAAHTTRFKDKRIKTFITENRGQCAAANFAFSKSSGRFIKFMDADDLISPGFIQAQVELISDNDNFIASAKWGRFYHNDIKTFKLNPESVWRDMKPIDWLVESLAEGPNMMQCALWLIPRPVLQNSGLWDESLSLINDFEFFIRVLLCAEKIKFAENAILYYRSGMNDSLSKQKSKKALYSGYHSTRRGCEHLLNYENSERTRRICADLYKVWHFECYPVLREESLTLLQLSEALGGSRRKFECGGFTKLLNFFIGWKWTKRLKHFASR